MKTLKQFICESTKETETVNGIKLTLTDIESTPRLLNALKSIAKNINSKDASLIKQISIIDYDPDGEFVSSPYDGYTKARYVVMIDLKKELDGVNDGPAFVKRIFPDVCKGVKKPNIVFGKNNDERCVIIYGGATDTIAVSFNDYFDSVEDDKYAIKVAKTDKNYTKDAEWAQDKTVESVAFVIRDEAGLNER